jgi:hypothetical protein
LLSAGALALAVSACTASPATVQGTFQAEELPRVDVTIAIDAAHRRDAERYRYAAFTTLKILGTWLAPFPDATLAVTAARTPWWTAPASMAPEFAVARAVSRRYWERAIDTRALPPPFVGALTEYAARRAVSKIVDERYFAVYRSRAEGRYFGGFVPSDLRVPLRVEDEGDPIGTDAPSARALLALGTLERWTGRPVFDAILLEFIDASSGRQPTLDDFERVASRVSGQNLSWLIDETVGKSGTFDYAIDMFESVPQPDGTFRTTVGVRRAGDAVFGRTLPLLTSFADGESVRDAVDGRRAAQTFEYRSQSRAVSAEVDPDRVLLLDVNHGNNGVTLDTGPARTAAARWTARWMIWLEDALLTYVAFT